VSDPLGEDERAVPPVAPPGWLRVARGADLLAAWGQFPHIPPHLALTHWKHWANTGYAVPLAHDLATRRATRRSAGPHGQPSVWRLVFFPMNNPCLSVQRLWTWQQCWPIPGVAHWEALGEALGEARGARARDRQAI